MGRVCMEAVNTAREHGYNVRAVNTAREYGP